MIQAFIFRNWKIFALAGTLITIYFLLRWGNAQRVRADEAEKGRAAAVEIARGWESRATTYQNKWGEVVTRVKAYELNDANIKAQKISWLTPKKFEKLKADDSNLLSAQAFDLSIQSVLIPHDTIYLPCTDSIKADHFEVKDTWNNIDIMVVGEPTVFISDRLYAVVTAGRPKNWFWRMLTFRRHSYEIFGEVTNSNKLVHVNSTLLIVQRRK